MACGRAEDEFAVGFGMEVDRLVRRLEHSEFSVVFTINIAESNFRYTQPSGFGNGDIGQERSTHSSGLFLLGRVLAKPLIYPTSVQEVIRQKLENVATAAAQQRLGRVERRTEDLRCLDLRRRH